MLFDDRIDRCSHGRGITNAGKVELPCRTVFGISYRQCSDVVFQNVKRAKNVVASVGESTYFRIVYILN